MNLRRIVLEMLLTQGIYSHEVVREVLHKYNYLSQQEKSFIKRLYEGTLERRIELDYVIDMYSDVKTGKMKRVIRTILQMSVYQILYMDSVPDAAACNEAVKLAQKKGFSTLRGFVNGVLRTIVREKNNIQYETLSVKYSMPAWIVDLWMTQLGVWQTECVLKGLLAEHPVTIRIRDTGEEIVGKLSEALQKQGGKIEQHPYYRNAYQIYRTDDIARLPYYDQGGFIIQDVSSMLAVEAIGIKNMSFHKADTPVKIVDICAAPGGKSILAADLLEAQGIVNYQILMRDISEKKAQIMASNVKRCGLDKTEIQLWDAIESDPELIGKADIVIADIPCSGLGVIGKKRDIKYNVTPQAIAEIIKLQSEILQTAVTYVKPGGRLLFSTCTVNCDENEKHYQWIKEEAKLTPVSINDALPACLHTETTAKGYVQLLPGIHNTDGFFISVFERTQKGEHFIE